MSMKTLWTFIVIGCNISVLALDLTVEVANGKIEGYSRTSPNNITFRAFQGIPYAKPPLGNLRFQAPVPADNWSDTIETKKDGSRCYSVAKDTDDEDENCLFINVYTPVLNEADSTLLPVMVYLFGGGFRDGASQYNVYGPDYLIERSVLMVSMNYRVGPFGFLSTADNIIPGNAGLKDQLLALKWVQTNIQKFGGDPKRVTIFGQSAGAASVGLHILSKESAGLFRGAIAESGAGISNWAFVADPTPYGYEIASLIDNSVKVNNSLDLLKFLQSVPAKDIDVASTKATIIDHPLPVIETEHDGAFLTKNMYESLKNGDMNKVPLLIGANSEEYISLATDMASLKKRAASYDSNLQKLVPKNMNVVDKKKLAELGETIKEIYLSPNQKFEDNLGLAIAFNSESHFLNPCVRHAELQSQYTDVYLYKFSYAGALGRNINVSFPGAERDTHGEELFYIFKRRMSGYDNSDLSKFPEHDARTMKRMVTLWTNFAKFLQIIGYLPPTVLPLYEQHSKLPKGLCEFRVDRALPFNVRIPKNPTPEADELLQNLIWPKMTPGSIHYVEVDTDLTIETEMKHGRYVKWRDLFEKEAISPVVF